MIKSNTNKDSYIAQKEYCDTNGYPMYAPKICFCCHRDVFEKISVEKASSSLITGCPHCHRSFWD